MIYKVSYVVQVAIIREASGNQQQRPEIGELVKIGPKEFEVIEVFEIMPPREDFQFLHATVKPAREHATKTN